MIVKVAVVNHVKLSSFFVCLRCLYIILDIFKGVLILNGTFRFDTFMALKRNIDNVRIQSLISILYIHFPSKNSVQVSQYWIFNAILLSFGSSLRFNIVLSTQ